MRATRSLLSVSITGLLLFSLVPGATGAVQADPLVPDPARIWQLVTDATAADRGTSPQVDPEEFVAYALDRADLASRLEQAPAEGSAAAPLVVSLPDPTGGFVRFAVSETSIMQERLAARHPDIRTYAGRAVDNPRLTVRLDLTSLGFHASVRGPAGLGSWYIDPYYNRQQNVYVSYFGDDLTKNPHGVFVESEQNRGEAQVQRMLGGDAPDVAAAAAGEQVRLRTYRLAFLTDPTYADYFGSTNVLDAKATLMNRVNQVYEDDLAITMVLVNKTDKLNLDTDEKMSGPNGPCGSAACYTPAQATGGCTGGLLSRNRIVIGQLIGADNYDIGHIGLGLNGGGVAGLGVVGRDGKARGCTGLPEPVGDFYAVDYVAHEMGHQFSGNHTFNGTQVNCGGNKAAPSVEPGSGSSVMAYAGICGQDNLSKHSDPYFSQRSLSEINTYVSSNQSVVEEVQTVSLRNFDTNGESFKLTYEGTTSAAFVRGTTYNMALLTAEIVKITGKPVTVTGFGGGTTAGDTGFQVAFTSSTRDLPSLELTEPTGDVAGFVGETAQGGPADNGGFTVEATTNSAPTVTSAGNHTIPRRTPFALTGAASDADGDVLSYMWEQNDAGGGTGTALVSNTKSNGPLFAQFGVQNQVTDAQSLLYKSPGQNKAGTSPTRVFPDMAQILVNNTNATDGTCPAAPPSPEPVPAKLIACYAEFLPTLDYGTPTAPASLNFRLTVRDTVPGAGGVGFADTKLTLSDAGPFLVTSHDKGDKVVPGTQNEITWAVNGTDAPALAPRVKISLSTNGGRTFPTVLAANTPNDGSHTVTFDAPSTDEARIKIEAVDNVFFDVNDAGFAIANTAPEAKDATATTYVNQPVNVQLNAFDPDRDTLTYTATNGANGSVSVSGDVATYSPNRRFVGADSFDFTVDDGTDTDTGTITVTVTRRDVVKATIELSDGEGSDDRIRVSTTPAVDTRVTFFKVDPAGNPVQLGALRSGSDGAAELTVVDTRPRRSTAYFARVRGTATTRPARTGRASIR